MKSPILAAALILAAGPAVAEEWKLSVTPYVWATDVVEGFWWSDDQPR